MKLMLLLFTPLTSYFILVFVVAMVESFGGRGTIGKSAFEEYIVIFTLVALLNLYIMIKEKLK